MRVIYQVCIPHTRRDFFDYEAGEVQPGIGARVWVPFRNTIKLGIVVGKDSVPSQKLALKKIEEVIDSHPLIDAAIMQLCQWISTYYQSYLSEVLPLALPKKYRLGYLPQLPQDDFYQLDLALEEALARVSVRAKKQQALLGFLAEHSQPVAKKELLQRGFSLNQLAFLSEEKILRLSQKLSLPQRATDHCSKPLILNSEQEIAVKTIQSCWQQFHCFLLQGVTGSGKTEVYLQLIAQLLAQGKQVLILVPEIGLTPQLLARFTARFTDPIAVIHSHLNDTERQVAWQLAKEKIAKIVIGTRAALFTPMPDLGLIIIDEEHDASLKQMEGVRYSARDSALMRAHFAHIPIILGSATPSLESLYNAQQGKYTVLSLPHKALSSTPLEYRLVDMRSQALQQGFANITLKTMQAHLQRGNQVLVFINRRGFAPVLLCHHCAWIADCVACDSHLTLHKLQQQLVCHHCGYSQPVPRHCLGCQQSELIPIGIGTQRVDDFLKNYFPEIAMLRIDRDAVQKKNSLNDSLQQIHQGDAQLIIGTQMLAKGHHFPRLSLVVVLDADAGLYHPDFRALEQLGQLLTQVAGRAGRAEHAGEVIIQTHAPDNRLLNVLIQEGYRSFAQELLSLRQQAQLPPYHYLALIRAQGKTAAAVTHLLQHMKTQLQHSSLTVLGPAPAPMAKKAYQHRMQLLLKSSSRKALNHALTSLRLGLTMNKLSQGIRWNIDVDPLDLS